MKKSVIELVRVSTAAQAADDRAGLAAQRAINRRTAQAYGLEITETISIEDVSGAWVLACPEMQRLLRLIESPSIQGVVTKEFSRLIRPEKYTDYALLEHFIETNTVLFLPDGPIDLSSKTGKFLGTIRAAVAGLERREILERMQDAKEALRRAGKHTGGSSTLPFGVDYSRNKGWFYTPEADKVRVAFALFSSGHFGYTEIARKLNIPRSNVRYLLQNPIYTGERVYDTRRDQSAAGYVPGPEGRQGSRKKIRRAAEDIIRVPVMEGIVTVANFKRVQEMIELRRKKHWRSRPISPTHYTYNGFLICGDCRAPLYTHTSKREFYICKTRHTRERRKRAELGLEPCSNKYMLREKLEKKINFLLGEKLLDASFVLGLVDAYNEKISQESAQNARIDLNGVERKISALKAKRDRILEAFYESLIDRPQRDEALNGVEREMAVYQGLAETSTLQNTQHLPVADLDAVQTIVGPFADWEFLTRDQRRSMLRHLCPEISVYKYAVRSLTLNLRVPSSLNSGGHLPAAAASPPAHSAETPATHPGTTRRCAPATLHPAAAPLRPQSIPHPRWCGAATETAASPQALSHAPKLPPRCESASSRLLRPATSAAKSLGSASPASSSPRPAAR